MNKEIQAFNNAQTKEEKATCDLLYEVISQHLPEAENKIWHAHPVWFLEGSPIVGYSKLKGCIRLFFWSGASFEEEDLMPGTGKFKDASIIAGDKMGPAKKEKAEKLGVTIISEGDFMEMVKN